MSFRFKHFFINDDRCAMKVGTDGVLLGAWTPTDNCQKPTANILDIGTGCGLVALMLAQRSPEAHIDAIDIDEAAVEQAKENFANSPWSDRLNAVGSPLQDWKNHQSQITNYHYYDLIVSNPPYFKNSLKNPDKGRQTARHTDTLSYEELLQHSARLLTQNGMLALILPAEAETEVRELAATFQLTLTHLTRVYSKESKPARRVLMAFAKTLETQNSRTLEDTLILEDDKGGRSRPYQELCKEFYL